MMPRKYRLKFITFIIIILFVIPTPITVLGKTTPAKKISALIAPSLASLMSDSSAEERIPVVFQFMAGTPPQMMEDVLRHLGGTGIEIRHVFHLIPMVSAYATKTAIARIAGYTRLQAVTLDVRVSLTETSRAYFAPAETSGYTHSDKLLGATELWKEGYNGSGITVAVLDSGAWGDHPDLQGKIIGFEDMVNGLSDMDPSDGISAYDDNGHGTATAWLVAGTGAKIGSYSGMAPGANLLIVKILDDKGATDDSVIAQGIEFAVDHEADVISLSIGGPWQDDNFAQPSVAASSAAVENGVAVVIAAGNSGPAAETINAPGVAQEAITVGASAGGEGVIAFSSRGPVVRTMTDPKGVFVKPDLVAPGFEVLSGRWDEASDYEYPIYNYTQFGRLYTRWSGTSAATPQVAGLVALLLDKYPGLSPLTAKAFLMGAAKDLGQDAMAQGMGLANVSRASEMIEANSRVITIMTPIRYPTLPVGSNVLIVGENRKSQNVTIISTVNHPSTEIRVTGNASDFITISTDSISIQTGYTYFGIRLTVPEDLPLSAVGQYTGNLDLVTDSETLARIQIVFRITTFGGRLLVDMSHHSADDPDDPSYYSYFEEYLRNQGVTTSWLGSPDNQVPADTNALSNAEIFMIMDTELDYSTTEINAIHKFVAEGGTLLILSEFYDTSTNTASFAFDAYNKILEPFGIQCERNGIGVGPDGQSGLVYGVGYGGIVENSSLMDGVDQLYILQGSTLAVNQSVANAQGLFWIDSEKKHAIVATAEYGRGKVIAISDGSTLYDTTLYDAIKRDADNLRLLRNIAAAIVPESPRIYDVKMETDGIGKTANLTAYIFDEDLLSVTMQIQLPDGSNITAELKQTLGYKYTTSFTFESGGFYKVSIVATDAEGNIRVFEKVILVSVELVDDMLVTAVVGALLVIVAIGIVYVVAIKFGVDKRVRKSEEEWEIPVSDDRPPEIV